MTFQDKWQNEAYKECCEERSRKFAIKLTEDGISPEKVAQLDKVLDKRVKIKK